MRNKPQLSPEQQREIFGEDANIFYNAEIMDPANPNVILSKIGLL